MSRSVLLIVIFTLVVGSAVARNPHVIKFRSPNLYPEGMAWDPSAQHFVVGSIHDRAIMSVSDAGVVETLISDSFLPENTTVLGLAVDHRKNRLLAAIHSAPPLAPFNALAAYDLRSGRRLFLSMLPSPGDTAATANAVAFDFKGNAYVTNSIGNFIWKVNEKGEASIFSRSPLFTRYPKQEPDAAWSECGLNGILYNSKGYLLVVQSNTGKMFRVDAEDGTAKLVLLPEDLYMVDDLAVRSDGVVLALSHRNVWFLKSDDSWAQGGIYDKTALDVEGFATSVAVGEEDRAYVLYGHVEEGIRGKTHGREMFAIEEVRSEKESGEDKLWVYLMLGLGLAYFLFWRFQMRQLVRNMDKKRN